MGTAGPQRPDRMPEDMPDGMSDRMPEDMSDRMPEDMPDRMPEDMSDRMPEDMPDRMPEDLPDRMPEDMPEHMPEDMPDRMPEDMSDRMPEDLPVRKCINVMVGITRSKVIYFKIYDNIMFFYIIYIYDHLYYIHEARLDCLSIYTYNSITNWCLSDHCIEILLNGFVGQW